MTAITAAPQRDYGAEFMSVAGQTIPPRVIKAVVERMREGAFTNSHLCEVAASELRACEGPVTTYFTVADRLIQKLKKSGDIVRVGAGRDAHWVWQEG